MASMREYWANEAAKMRDTSGVLGREVLMPVSSTRNDYAPNEDSGKVSVRGTTPTQLKAWVAALSSEKQKMIFKAMNEHLNLSFNFSSQEELTVHLKIREAIIARIIQVEKAFDSDGNNPIALYPQGRETLILPKDYWVPIPNSGFIREANVNTFVAIESLLQDGSDKAYKASNLVIDCNRMSVVVAFVALSDVLGKDTINKMFASNRNIVVGTWHEFYKEYGNISLLSNKYFNAEQLYSPDYKKPTEDLCIPGDIVYFENDSSYKSRLGEIRNYLYDSSNSIDERNALLGDARLTSAWTGEYCICTGKDTFAGFGLRESENTIVEFSSEKIKTTLLKAATDLYELAKDKVKPIRERIKKFNIPPPSMRNVKLRDVCYRVDTSAIIKKM